MTLSILKIAPIDRHLGCQLAHPMILSFEKFTNILFMWLNNNENINFFTFDKVANIDNIVFKIDFCPFPILFLILQFTIIQLLLLVQNQKTFIDRIWRLCRISKIRTIFIFFNQGQSYLNAAKLVERIHNLIDLLWRSCGVDNIDFLLEVIFHERMFNVYNRLIDLSFKDFLRKEVLRIFILFKSFVLYTTYLFLHLTIHHAWIHNLYFVFRNWL